MQSVPERLTRNGLATSELSTPLAAGVDTMPGECQRLGPWINEFLQVRHPDLVLPCLRAAEAFDRSVATAVLNPADAELLTSSSLSNSSILSEYAASLLGRLARRFEAARGAIQRLSMDTKVRARVNALVALQSLEICDLHETIARTALIDRSAKVRNLAADRIRGWNLTQLLPDLERAITHESNEALRSTLEKQRDLLRDGYCTKRDADGDVHVTYQKDGGLISRLVRDEEFRKKGVAAIARELGVDLAGRPHR